MEIIPAIDIRGGRCVRLTQGDFQRETIFADDPVAVARRWQEAGARRLHVVDLDGARRGQPVNAAAVQGILGAVSIAVQVGGGLRDLATIQQYLEMGADRVVLGTAAIRDQRTIVDVLARFGERIVVAVDAREGRVVVEGWRQAAKVSAAELIAALTPLGVCRFIYTDVLRDGTLSEPNFPAIEQLLADVRSLQPPACLIYSGGISSIEHLLSLASLGLEGAIVGKALYAGAIDLRKALAALLSA